MRGKELYKHNKEKIEEEEELKKKNLRIGEGGEESQGVGLDLGFG